jgi:predicted nuclease of restriction endonuclease-like (RecB) superfamily
MQETIEGNWSTRLLDRQTNSLYYERVLMSRKKGRTLLEKEIEEKK